ncbi:MAG: HD domain-containing protein [Desulfobacterales bacterium]|nr:HD domain-containing protein [Desulfobacterales bacterium]
MLPPEPGSEPEPASESHAEAFVLFFKRLLQTARIHEANNRLTVNAAGKFLETSRQLLSEKAEIIIEARHERLFVQGEKLLLRQQTAPTIFTLLGIFETLSLYGLKFNFQLPDISYSQAYQFARILIEAPQQEAPLEWMQKYLDQDRFEFVDIINEPQGEGNLTEAQKMELAHRAYSYAYNTVKEVTRKIRENHAAGVRKAVRVVQDITDLVFIDKSILMGLSTIRDYDDYTYTHSVNVAVNSLCLGHEIGLSRNSLVRLGICGLFHDLGKVDIPIEIINKAGRLNHEEYKKIQQHSLNSVRQILKLEAYRELIAQIILPPFEHHLKYDLSGYPAVNWSKPISLFGRIIEISDVYDALTAPRVYRPTTLSPDRALGFMLSKSGKDFDPILLKWFINMMGVYPAGTLVKLNTGQVGLIYKNGDPEDQPMPKVLVLRKDKSSKQLKTAELLDLNERAESSGKYRHTVEKTYHPAQYGIQPAMYLMEAQSKRERR